MPALAIRLPSRPPRHHQAQAPSAELLRWAHMVQRRAAARARFVELCGSADLAEMIEENDPDFPWETTL